MSAGIILLLHFTAVNIFIQVASCFKMCQNPFQMPWTESQF